MWHQAWFKDFSNLLDISVGSSAEGATADRSWEMVSSIDVK